MERERSLPFSQNTALNLFVVKKKTTKFTFKWANVIL